MAQQRAIFGGGCFWCTDAVFRQVKGVSQVISGYAGGARANPSYEQICTGATGHAEVIAVDFDDSIIGFDTLLDIFFATNDPTTLNRPGNDVDTQNRSVICSQNEQQQHTAQAKIEQLKQQGINAVTELSPAVPFYEAESYHQDFYTKNPTQGYCNFSIPPKLSKLKQYFSDQMA